MSAPDLMTVDAAASYLADLTGLPVTRSTVYRARRDGRLRASRVGRHYSTGPFAPSRHPC